MASVKRGEAVAASAAGLPPALLTSTSKRPASSSTASTKRRTCSGSRTSAAMNCALGPGSPESAAGALRAQAKTWAPPPRKALTMPWPMPRLPPVMSTTLSSNVGPSGFGTGRMVLEARAFILLQNRR